MKLMKIFGMVFALHVALACVLVLIQGCRSKPSPPPDAGATAAAVESEPANWSSQSSSLAPTPVDSAPGSVAPVTAAPLSSLSPAERERAAPTRPANPAAFISTGTPAAIAPPPPEPATYVIRSGDSLWKIAKAQGTTTAELQKLNPTLKASALRPGMIIKVPGVAAPAIGMPAATLSSSVAPGPVAPAAESTYIVRSGDSLSKVAARNGTTVAALRAANNLRSDVIQVGQELKIPNRGAEAGSTAFGVGEAPLPPPGTPAPAMATENSGQVSIVLQRGDTLGAIAKKFGITVSDLMAENNITDPTKVRVGQKLVIPGFHAVGTGAIPLRSTGSTTTPARAPVPAAATPRPSAPVNEPSPVLPPPVVERPAEFDAPAIEGDAPPVQPIEGDPVPAP